MVYIQGTGTCRSHQRMKIISIGGQDVLFNFIADGTDNSWTWISVWFFCVALCLSVYSMTLQRSGVTLILWLSLYCIVIQRIIVTLLLCFSVYLMLLQRSVVTLHLCFLVYFMICCCYASQFILCFSKETQLRYSYTSIRKNIFNVIIIWSNFGKHKNMLC